MKPYRIPEITRKYVEYDMIQSNTELPPIPDLRLRLLHATLNEQRSLSTFSELYSVVISLVQLGMDTHDLVDTDPGNRPLREMRARQLKVLAGDYFSGRFYHLLSQAGQIEMVSKISAAVCEVNRLKMNLYITMKQLKLTGEDYLNQTVQLKSELFQIFSGLMEEKLSRLWPELLRAVSRFEVILDELKRSESASGFHLSWAYWHVLQEGTDDERSRLAENEQEPSFVHGLIKKYDIRNQLADKLRAAAAGIRHAAARLESEKLASELSKAMDSYLDRSAGTASALGETR